mgnify:CR=1 FL=1
MIRNLLAATLTLAIAVPALAQSGGNRLVVGSEAPGLAIEDWVKGDPVTIEKDKVYLVEFWATWCGPCKKSIPHLTELQESFGDDGLVVIGVSIDDELETVEKFVKSQGRKMDYTVAFDNRGRTERAWMGRAKMKGIPCSFLVDGQGKLQFIGHPQDEDLEETIELVLDGRYNKKLMDAAKPHLAEIARARKVQDFRMADKVLEEVIATEPMVFAHLILEKFEMKLIEQNDPRGAYQYAREVINTRQMEDPIMLTWLAEKIVTDPNIPDRDRNYQVAMEAAEASVENGRPNDPRTMSTVAMVFAKQGNIEDAVVAQKRAWYNAPRKHKEEQYRLLKQYIEESDRQAAQVSTQ